MPARPIIKENATIQANEHLIAYIKVACVYVLFYAAVKYIFVICALKNDVVVPLI